MGTHPDSAFDARRFGALQHCTKGNRMQAKTQRFILIFSAASVYIAAIAFIISASITPKANTVSERVKTAASYEVALLAPETETDDAKSNVVIELTKDGAAVIDLAGNDGELTGNDAALKTEKTPKNVGHFTKNKDSVSATAVALPVKTETESSAPKATAATNGVLAKSESASNTVTDTKDTQSQNGNIGEASIKNEKNTKATKTAQLAKKEAQDKNIANATNLETGELENPPAGMNGMGGADIAPQPGPGIESSDLYYTVYRIKQGDMIGVLAENHGVTQDTLISVNNIKQSRTIQVGQYIRIPSMPGIVYTTKSADETPTTIAEKYNVSATKVAAVNQMDVAGAFSAGTTLFVPDAELDWVTRQEINGDLFTRPLRRGYYISSRYSWRSNPFSGKRTFHNGIDMACAKGTPIYAALAGTVVATGWDNVYGNYVTVSHHSGYKTLYGHMSKITAKKGQHVTTATKIGEVGSTGQSTGPHLHFTVYKNGRTIDPAQIWN